MQPDLRGGQRRLHRLVAYGSSAVGAGVSQVLVAGSSLVLQLIAARSLSAAGLGRFSLLMSILITFNSVHTGWIGDSLTVLDRFDHGVRGALLRSQLITMGLASVVGVGGAMAFSGAGWAAIVGFGLATTLWVLEDTGRRVMMARLDFWALVVNDLVYALVSLGSVGVVVALGHAVTLGLLVWAIALGAAAAFAVGLVQLPADELRRPPAGSADMRRLSSFAAWRALHVVVLPSSQFLMRVIVAAMASTAALGRLEAARLLVAPVIAAINGAGTLLLPRYSEGIRKGTFSITRVRQAMVLLAGAALVAGGVAFLALDEVAPLLTRGRFSIETEALWSWTLLAIAFGLGIPSGLALVAKQRSQQAFYIRLVTTAAGVGAAALLAGAVDAAFAPAGLALGGIVGALLLLRAVTQTDRPPAPDPGRFA